MCGISPFWQGRWAFSAAREPACRGWNFRPYVAIVVWSFIQFRVRAGERTYISQWYLLAAMMWFPWVFVTANGLLHLTCGHPLMAAAINAWFKSAMIFLFFIPVALGTAYYLAPKVSGRPIPSNTLAMLGFWSLAVVAPWAGMQKLAGAPLPVFLPYLGAAATALLAVPLATAGINILRSIFSSEEKLPKSPALHFTAAGLLGVMVLAVAAIALNLPGSSLRLTQFSISGYGFDILAIYGCFSFMMFGAVYFIVPRITCREWISSRLINMHFFFSAYGIVAIAFGALFGGFIQGSAQEAWLQPWEMVTDVVRPYSAVSTFAWCVILFSNIFFCFHLAMMWLGLGRRDRLREPPHEVSRHEFAEIEFEILEICPGPVHANFLAVETERRHEDFFRQPGRRVRVQARDILDAHRGARSEKNHGDGGCGKPGENQ